MAKNQNNEVNVSREIKELMDSGIALNKLPKLIEQMYRANLNLFVWGDPGIGKTQSVEQFVTKMKQEDKEFEYFYYPLSSMEPADLIGIPMPEKVSEYGKEITKTTWAIPKCLPTNPNGKGLLYFDEMNNAPAAMQNAVQQLVQERRIGDYFLPDGYRIIAAGNQSGVNAYSTEIQAPVKDRFGHIFVKTNADVWFDYILGLDTTPVQDKPFIAGITPEKIKQMVAAFVKRNPDKLFDTENYNNNSYTFGTPRSWSRFIKLYSMNTDASYDEVFHFASMYFGGAVANMLLEYLKNSEKYQDPAEILFKGKDFRDDGDINGFFGTLTGCIATLNQMEYPDKDENGKPDKTSKEGKALVSAVHNMFEACKKLKKADWQAILTKHITQNNKLVYFVSAEDIKSVAKFCTAKTTL